MVSSSHDYKQTHSQTRFSTISTARQTSPSDLTMTSTVKLPSNSSGNPNILPMPLNNSSPVSTAPDIISLDYYFWNQSLPADDVVCTADITENIAEACCPPAIGLWSTAGLGYGACRMRNTKANEEYHKNCTAQYALELNVSGTPEAVNATCTPFTTYLNVSWQERHDRLANAPTTNLHLDKGVESVPMCASVGDPGHWNYTGQCCAKVNGALKRDVDDRPAP